MSQLKKIHRQAVPKALERVERYRLLNQPRVAESICRDILAVDGDNQQALVGLVLALTDQFDAEANAGMGPALELVDRLEDEYERTYYAGIVHERQAKARLRRGYPGARFDAHELLQQAMALFARADEMSPPENDDGALHWNACLRLIESDKLEPRPEGEETVMLE